MTSACAAAGRGRERVRGRSCETSDALVPLRTPRHQDALFRIWLDNMRHGVSCASLHDALLGEGHGCVVVEQQLAASERRRRACTMPHVHRATLATRCRKQQPPPQTRLHEHILVASVAQPQRHERVSHRAEQRVIVVAAKHVPCARGGWVVGQPTAQTTRQWVNEPHGQTRRSYNLQSPLAASTQPHYPTRASQLRAARR